MVRYDLVSSIRAKPLRQQYLYYVETKGRSLEEIDLIFEALHEGRQVKDVERETKGLLEHREKAAARM